MKVLLDECLPLNLRRALATHEAHTAEWAGFKGKTNGELLDALEAAGYDVFLTTDKGIPRQQNLSSRRFAVAVLDANTNRLEDLLPLVGALLEVLEHIRPGETVHIRADAELSAATRNP